MRHGRLNTVESALSTITKTCVVSETSRPHKLLVEKWALEEAYRQGINVPKVINYARDYEGKEVLVLERIPGRPLGFKPSRENVEAFKQIGHMLSRRTCRFKSFGWINPKTMRGVYPSWKDFLCSFSERYGKQLLECCVLDSQGLDLFIRQLENNTSLDLERSAIVHRDIKPQNIVWGERGAYLIDWENVILGDPNYDLAIYLVRFGNNEGGQVLISSVQDMNEELMSLYQISALIGLIDFCLTYAYGVKGKIQRLKALLRRLK